MNTVDGRHRSITARFFSSVFVLKGVSLPTRISNGRISLGLVCADDRRE